MTTHIIKVLWIEDDIDVYNTFSDTASTYNISFIHADNWIDGKKLLKDQYKEISAIILDAQCKWDKDSIAEDNFIKDVLSELWELFGETRKPIPWYILSAGTMNNYADIIETANNRKRKNYDKIWGEVSWSKKIVKEFDNNPLLTKIREVSKTLAHNIVLSRHQETFKYLGTEGNLCQAARITMLNAFLALYAPDENIGFEFKGNPMRTVLEHMFRHANKLGIIPDAFLDNHNNPIVADCKNFMIGEIPKHVKFQLWDTENNKAFSIFPSPLSDYLENVLNFGNADSHSKEEENRPYIINSDEKDLFFAMTLHLSHLICHYGRFIDSHRDIEKNKRLSRPISIDITDRTDSMVVHYVEGPICIDNLGKPYIKDVLLPDSYKQNAGQIYCTKKVLINTRKQKEHYKYFAPKVFKI